MAATSIQVGGGGASPPRYVPVPDFNLEKLSPKPGDVLVLQVPPECGESTRARLMVELAAALDKKGIKGVLMLVIAADADLSLLPESEMAAHGWVRAKAVKFREFL